MPNLVAACHVVLAWALHGNEVFGATVVGPWDAKTPLRTVFASMNFTEGATPKVQAGALAKVLGRIVVLNVCCGSCITKWLTAKSSTQIYF